MIYFEIEFDERQLFYGIWSNEEMYSILRNATNRTISHKCRRINLLYTEHACHIYETIF